MPVPPPGPRGVLRLEVPALFLVASCRDDSTGLNTPPSGTYALATVNGSPPPALIARTGTVEARITSGSADFFESGRVRIAFTIDWTGADNSQSTTSHVLEGAFHSDGPLLLFDSGDMSGRYDAHSVTITHGIRTSAVATRVAERYVR